MGVSWASGGSKSVCVGGGGGEYSHPFEENLNF